MAGEIVGIAPSGTLYARIRNAAGLWWNGSSFEAYSAVNYATYVIAMVEEGNSSVYVADFPSGITSSGTYKYYVHRTTTSAAEGDTIVNTGTVDWTGSASATTATGSMTATDFFAYFLRKGFKRSDKDTEFYEACTDAIQEMRRRFMFDEAEAELETTDTISALGEFRINVETNFGLLMGVVLEDDDTGTPLNHITKAQYDKKYPSVNVENDKGYPLDFCIYAGDIYIGPIPDSVDYVYRLSYSTRAGSVTASTTNVPFTALYRDILADNINSRMWELMEEFERAAYYRGRFETGFEDAKVRERHNSGEGHFNVGSFGL